MSTKKTSHQAISRILREAGYGITVDYRREGVRVRRSASGAMVTAQFDGTSEGLRMAKQIAEFLSGKGYATRISENFVFVR